MIINVSSSEIAIALTENKKLVELHKEKGNNKFTVGDIYVARVRKTIDGLNAAFVDVGYRRDAFLHYFDLGAQFNSQQKYLNESLNPNVSKRKLEDIILEKEINKLGKISDVLAKGQLVFAQIAKEPISSKGPRLSSEISVVGRNLVIIPFSNKISISQKISEKAERKRLKNLIQSIRPNNYGVIIRTAAKNKKVALLDDEMRTLVEKWETIFDNHKEIYPPKLIIGELSRPVALLRDVFNNSIINIHINNKKVYTQVKEYISKIAPDKTKIVKYYNGNLDIFEYFGIIKQIKGLFGKIVNIKSGAYLVIEQTEALHVIDVNSGNRAKKTSNQETNALEVNMLAAKEVARQLRMRDLGGIIVVDFIDMRQNENKKKIFDTLRSEMQKDRTKHSILPLSKFGIMQITRQRVRQETKIKTKETCPTCDGTGEVIPSILFIDEIENHLRYILNKYKNSVTIKVHPYIAGYLKNGFMSRRMQWFKKFKRYVQIKHVMTYSLLEYRFFNKKGKRLN